MLKLKPFRQSPNLCGPAALKIVLDYYGFSATEKYLAKLAKSDNYGTRAKNLVTAAKKLGFEATLEDDADISDIKKYVLKKKIPVIVDWFSVDDGHYSVVSHIDKKFIYLQDPQIGKIQKIELNIFKRVWFDFTGPFIKKSRDLVLRRLIAVFPKNERAAHRNSLR